MPTFTRSVLNPNGTYQSDAMDQVEQWNANRGDQWSRYALDMLQKQKSDARQQAGDDWRKDVALQQLGLQRDQWGGSRQDAAKQFEYMTGRDAAADARWQKEWAERSADAQQARADRAIDYGMRKEEAESNKSLRELQREAAKAALSADAQRATTRAAASGQVSYMPQTDAGKQAYLEAEAMTGDKFQASVAAKQADRSGTEADAAASRKAVEAGLEDFSAKDTSLFSSVGDQEAGQLKAQVQAYAALLRKAGWTEDRIGAEVKQMLRDKLTTGGRTDINAGPSEWLLSQFGATYR